MPDYNELIDLLENYIFAITAQKIPDSETHINRVDDQYVARDLVYWGTHTSDYGKSFNDGRTYKETFFRSKMETFLVSTELKLALAVDLYLALQDRHNYGNGLASQADYPAWYLDGRKEPEVS